MDKEQEADFPILKYNRRVRQEAELFAQVYNLPELAENLSASSYREKVVVTNYLFVFPYLSS